MSNPPPIIEYASTVIPGEIQVRRDGPNVVIIIPPPSPWRSILLVLIRGIARTAILTCAILLVITILNANQHRDVAPWALAWLGVSVGVLRTLIQLVRTARSGKRTTVIRASPDRLELAIPHGSATQSRTWSATDLLDLTATEGRVLAVLACHINFQIVFRLEHVEQFQIAWNGNGALASIEDNLRDVLRLPRTAQPE